MDEHALEQVFSRAEWQGIIKELKIPQRQSQALSLLFCGYSDKQISLKLGIAVPTVRTYLHRLFARFDVQDRQELVLHVFGVFRQHCRDTHQCPVKAFYEHLGLEEATVLHSVSTLDNK